MMLHANETPTLSSWISAVSQHLESRRLELRGSPKPKRNRDRERARREARQLFREYEAERAIRLAS